MTIHVKPTWEQVLATRHWHPCDLATHTIAQCRAEVRHDHALAWAGDVLSTAALLAVSIAIVRLLRRAALATQLDQPARD